jgi:RNA polymerase sigma-70 factor (ECF subfamily)
MRSGDEAALGALYDRWSRVAHAYVLHLLGDADEAEDVIEESFWQLWRQAERYEQRRGSVGTWIITVARSRALDRLRVRQRRREDPLPPPSTPAPPDLVARDADPSAAADAADRRALVLAALTALPPEQRAAIELAYFSGLSQTEIAAHTGLPLGTVKTRMRLGMRKLRELLRALDEREETP